MIRIQSQLGSFLGRSMRLPMFVRVFLAIVLVVAGSGLAFSDDHPLEIVPANVRGAVVFPNLTKFKTNGDKMMAAVQKQGISLSVLMSWAGNAINVTAAADDDKPMGVFWMDSSLVAEVKGNRTEVFAAMIPISDVKRLSENLEVDIEKLKSGAILRNSGRVGYQNRFHKFVNDRLYIASHKELFKHLFAKERITKFLPQSRLEFLKDSDAIAIFSAPKDTDKSKGEWFSTYRNLWNKENMDADAAEKEVADQLFDAISKVTHASVSLRVDQGMEFDVDLYFGAEQEKTLRQLMTRLNPKAHVSSLAGLAKGHVLMSHASSVSGEGSLPALTILGRELLKNIGPTWRRLDQRKIISETQQLAFMGIFGEVWHQLDGYRMAVYRNEDETKHGLTSMVAILDTKDPQDFIRDMRQLAGLLDGTGLAPQGDDNPKVETEETIKKLIVELGDRSFRTRHSATTRLTLIGEPALKLIVKAKASLNREVARRAQMIEANIRKVITRKRTNVVQPSLISKAKPKFIFFSDREKRAGQTVHWVEIKTDATSELRPQLRLLFGPKWQHIRLVPLKGKVVVALGSDTRLLDATLANLEKGRPGLETDKQNPIFKRRLNKNRSAEFHISLTRILDLEAAKRPPVAKDQVPPTFEQVSIGVTLQPRYLNLEWRIPQGQIQAVWKHF
jgi:hypothetical protein